MKIGQYQVSKTGRPPIYNHEKIMNDIVNSTKTYIEIATEHGCHRTTVLWLRRKNNLHRKMFEQKAV
jgi:transposase-like protein